jgi:hypothetical protein
MTRFIIVNPHKRTIEAVPFDSLIEAQASVGLDNVDHGALWRGLGYVVHQHSLFFPPSKQAYCGIAHKLIAGPAVFYGYDQAGETVDLRRSELPDMRWYLGVNDVEAAIEREEIVRPIIAMNHAVMWEWPQPAPKGFGYGD